jgi:NitT/TauT family transport system substrate-binding protein
MLQRPVCLVATTVLWVLLAVADLAAQPRATVAYSAISPIMAGVWMAKEIGAFDKHGVKAELVYISSGAITVQAMVGGDLHMTVAASNAVVSAILRGAPLIAVGSVTSRPAMSLWVQPEITKPEQLEGKIVGITRHGSTTHFLTLAVMERLGLRDKVKLQPFGGTVEADTAFRVGLIAGRVASVKPDPKAHSLIDLPKLGIPFSMDLIAVKQEFHKSSAKTVEAMLKAYIEGVAALRKKERALKVLAKYLGGRAGGLDEPYEYALKYLDREPRVDPAVIQTVLDWEGKPDTPVQRFFDNSVIDRLAREGFIDNLYKGGT